MNKTKLNIIIDILLLLNGIIVALSGFMMWFTGFDFLDIEKSLLKKIHKLSSIILIILILIHLILHWYWIKCIPKMLK